MTTSPYCRYMVAVLNMEQGSLHHLINRDGRLSHSSQYLPKSCRYLQDKTYPSYSHNCCTDQFLKLEWSRFCWSQPGNKIIFWYICTDGKLGRLTWDLDEYLVLPKKGMSSSNHLHIFMSFETASDWSHHPRQMINRLSATYRVTWTRKIVTVYPLFCCHSNSCSHNATPGLLTSKASTCSPLISFYIAESRLMFWGMNFPATYSPSLFVKHVILLQGIFSTLEISFCFGKINWL